MDDVKDAADQERAGIQSVEIAATLLEALAVSLGPLPLTQIAAAAGMPPSKAHRYLVSLCRTGLVRQDGRSGRYDIGPRGLALGLAALGRLDAVTVASDALRGLSEAAGATANLAVWGDHGPTVVRFEESSHPVRVNIRVGSTLPVGASAIGQVFAAFLPPPVIAPFRAAEAVRDAEAVSDRAFGRVLDDIRAQGVSRSIGSYIAGVTALAAPVFDAQGRIVAVMALLGHEPSLDASWQGRPIAALRESADAVSRQLGYGGKAPPAPR